MTRGSPSEVRPFDPEIERIFHGGRRHLRNQSLHVDYTVTFHTPNTSHFVHSLHSKHTVYCDRSDFHTDNMAQ